MDFITSKEQVLHDTIDTSLVDADVHVSDKPKMTIETSKFKKKQSPKRSFYV